MKTHFPHLVRPACITPLHPRRKLTSCVTRMIRHLALLISSLVLLAGTAMQHARAQSESGNAAIEGVVLDSNGATVANAAITIQNVETGLERTASTGSNGRFNVSVLPVGRYTVKVEAKGFGTVEHDEVSLRVGQAPTLDFTLKPAAPEETVRVTPDPEGLDKQEGATSSLITPRTVESLPVRGRNFAEFAQLTPSVVQESDRFGLVIAGQRSINSNVAIDGADFNDALQGNQRGGNEGVFFFPQTAIREFQVVRSGATAEIGRTTAGFINAVTKSGTNQVRGEAFYFNRNRPLTSPDAFDFKGNNQQNQFGGSVGGPIVRDRAFFFLGFEQNYLGIPYNVVFDPQASGVTLPASLLALQGEQRASNNPTAFFGRVDWNISRKNTLNLNYTYSRLRGDNFNSSQDGSGSSQTNVAATANYKRTTDSNGFKAGLVTIVSPRVINEVRGQIASDNRSENSNTEAATVVITGVGTIGADSGRPRLFDTTRYELADNVTYNASGYSVRFGFDANINRARQERESNLLGRWDFKSLADYLAGKPSRYRQTLPGFDPSALIFRGTQKEFGLFVQDRFALRRNIMLTGGIRWDAQWNPQPANPNPAIPQTGFIPADTKMFQPRLGLAWDVSGKSSTVVRLSAGLFDARTPANLFQRVFTDNGITTLAVDIKENASSGAANGRLRGTTALVTFPSTLTAAPKGFVTAPRVFGLQPDFRNPRSFQAAGTIEHSFTGGLVFTAGYIHNSTWNLQRRIDRNLFPPTLNFAGLPIFPATRPNPTIGILDLNESSAHSRYDGLNLVFSRRFAKRYQLEMNYTLAKTRDDDSNERNFSRETALNPFDLSIEDGPSKQDIRHRLNLSGLVDLGHGFMVSGILVARSAFPYNAVIGTDQQNDGNDNNDRAIINGHVVSRFAFRQPNFFDLDLRVLKSFKLGETRQIELSAEGFNITRNSNKGFGSDSESLYGTPAAPLPTAGIPLVGPTTARFGGPRQLQLGVRFSF
jgi:Carboxypeptidase regulatory-like domain